MSDKSMELMKQFIEDKKNRGTNQSTLRPNKKTSGSTQTQKGFKNLKKGGFFDK